MDLDVDVARLKLMKANHQSQQYRLEDNMLRYLHISATLERQFRDDLNTATAVLEHKNGGI